jgi:hypothetical protein
VAAKQRNEFPTWVVVVAIIILFPVLFWALVELFNLLTAMSVGGILILVGIVVLFIWLRRRVDEEERR